MLQFMGSQRVRHDLATEQQILTLDCLLTIFIDQPPDAVVNILFKMWNLRIREVKLFI